MRVTQSGQLSETDGSSSSNRFLGKKDKDFAFSDLKSQKVQFVECSARGLKGETDGGSVEQVQEWLEKIA